MGDKQLIQAAKEQKLAEDALKTSLFGNWKADTDNAAHHYEKAGQLFKAFKSYSQAKTCFINASKNYTTARVFFSVGKCCEQAAQCCKELKQLKECYDLIEKAGYNYIQNGTNTTATQCLVKGAALIADELPEEAVILYTKAGDLEVDNDKFRDAVNCYTGAMKIYAKLQKYDKCMTVVKTLRAVFVTLDNWAQVTKMDMTMVILHLARGDSIAAKISEGELTSTAHSLIAAVEEEDLKSLKALSQHSEIVYLDTDIARIARHLTLNGAELPNLDKPNERKFVTGQTPSKNTQAKISSSLLSQREELFGKKEKSPSRPKAAPAKPSPGPAKPSPAPASPPAAIKNSNPSKEDCQALNPFDTKDETDGNPFDVKDETDGNPFDVKDEPASNPFDEDEDLC